MSIAQLNPSEAAHVDPDALASLHARLGPNGAEQALTSAIEQSISRLGAIRKAVQQQNAAGVEQLATSLAELAEQVGMISYAHVARSVAQCAHASDSPALAATLARLDRIGDRSMLAVWGGEDISG